MNWNPLRWLGQRGSLATRRLPWPLDLPVMHWTKNEPFTLDEASKGVQVWGMTGSGKSSGSGKALALSYLRHGFGGLVLCAKPGEAATWLEYCRSSKRDKDIVVFSPSDKWRFNFLEFELQRPVRVPVLPKTSCNCS